MPKRVTKNDVLYLDRHVAIIDCKGTDQTGTNAVQWLLKVGTNHDDELQPIRQLLERYTLRPLRRVVLVGTETSELDSPEQIRALGFDCSCSYNENGQPQTCVSESGESGRCCVRVDTVRETAEAVRYVATLALLARGDDRAADLITLLESENNKRLLRFDAVVPGQIIGEVEVAADWLEMFPNVTVEEVEPHGNDAGVRLVCYAIASSYYRGDVVHNFPDCELERKRIAANVLASLLLNLSVRIPYYPDPESGLPEHSITANLLTVTIDQARDGKLEGCPHCGWPVVRPYKSSDPYCRKSHRTRTDEKRG